MRKIVNSMIGTFIIICLLIPFMGCYPNGNLLVGVNVLEEMISNTQNLIIIDARSAGYDQTHIPGAISLKWQDFGAPNLNPISEIEQMLTLKGIRKDATLVIYDDTTESWGAAGRIFWTFEYLGCEDVRVLNGGWDKWIALGKPTETTINTLPPLEQGEAFVAEINTAILATTDHVRDRRQDADFVIIDSRTDEEFIGWTLYDEARGGHISGAVQIPYESFFNEDKTILGHDDLKELFESRGITSDKEVTSYCTAGIRSGFIYLALRLMGYPNCSNYDASIYGWAAGDSVDYPMEELNHFDELIYPRWVKELIDYHAVGSTDPAPANYPYERDHKYLIFETQWGSFEDMEKGWADDSYIRGHIPGAIHSNSDIYENGYPRWFLLPDDQLKTAAGLMGITADTTIVVYSNSPIFAARLWWILKYIGVEDVRILNGGYDAWNTAGYEIETTINNPVPTTYEGTVHPEIIATTDYVEANYDSNYDVLADVRTYDEYLGNISGYSYVVNKGRIPGAIYAFNADEPDREYLDDDGTLRSYTDMCAMWQTLGIESTVQSTAFDKRVIFYCGSGYRSSLAFLYAYLMGYQNVRNYSDGWEGWSTTYIEDPEYVADPNLPGSTDGWIQELSGRPVETGIPSM